MAHVVTRDVREVEADLFIHLHEFRVQANREFFDCRLDIIIDTLLAVVGDRLLSENFTVGDRLLSENFTYAATSTLTESKMSYSTNNKRQINNFGVVDQWLFAWLSAAKGEVMSEPWESLCFGSTVPKEEIFETFRKRTVGQGEVNFRPVNHAGAFWKHIHKYKSIFTDFGQLTVEGFRQRFVRINSIEDCRKAFDIYHGISFIWESGSDIEIES
tara:strand:- start:405 stop:1049 length:645 start_codon:yes stop_codon:yes gene_type:complete